MLGCGQCLISIGQVIAIASACAVPVICNKAHQVINKKKRKKKETPNDEYKNG
jgi:hypothetical protein